MRDTHTERQRHRQREKQAPCRETNVGLDPGSPGSHLQLKAVLNRGATWAAQVSNLLLRKQKLREGAGHMPILCPTSLTLGLGPCKVHFCFALTGSAWGCPEEGEGTHPFLLPPALSASSRQWPFTSGIWVPALRVPSFQLLDPENCSSLSP